MSLSLSSVRGVSWLRCQPMRGRAASRAWPPTCAVIAHTQSGIVSVLDARSLRVRARLRGFREPRYTAADVGGRDAYVSDSGRQDVARVDVLRGEVLERLALGGAARHVSLSPDGRLLWVALGSKANRSQSSTSRVDACGSWRGSSRRFLPTTSGSRPVVEWCG